MGGALTAIERGYMQNEIQNAAYAAQQAVEKKEDDRGWRKCLRGEGRKEPREDEG